MCQTNKYYAQLCNEDFFRNRIAKRYLSDLNGKPKNLTWRQYYYQLANVGNVSIPFFFGEKGVDVRHKLFNITIPRSILNLINPATNPNLKIVKEFYGAPVDYAGDRIYPKTVSTPFSISKEGSAAIRQFGEYVVHQLNNYSNNIYFTVDVRYTNSYNQGELLSYKLEIKPLEPLRKLLDLSPRVAGLTELYMFVDPNMNNQITSLVMRPVL
jgi:hypothetical protein